MRTYDPMKSKKRSMNEPSSMSSDVSTTTEKIKDKKSALDEVMEMSSPRKPRSPSFNPHGVTWG